MISACYGHKLFLRSSVIGHGILFLELLIFLYNGDWRNSHICIAGRQPARQTDRQTERPTETTGEREQVSVSTDVRERKTYVRNNRSGLRPRRSDSIHVLLSLARRLSALDWSCLRVFCSCSPFR